MFCSSSPTPLFFFNFFPLAGRKYKAREFRPRNLSHNNYHFQAATLFSIKAIEQLAMFSNSCENCCLTSSDYSSDTFKNKLVNSAGFRGSLRVYRRGVGLWGRRVFDRSGRRGGPGWRTNDPRKMLSC